MKMPEKIILRLLEDAVGKENVSDDESILIAYSRDQYWNFVPPKMPDYVVRPKNTEEVQAVMRIANRYRIPVIPMSSGVNVRGLCIPEQGGIVLELKRMNRIIEINKDAMTATVEPGVTMVEFVASARKLGLRPAVPGAPAVVSPVSNYMLRGVYHHISSIGIDHVLSMEMVLPNGELLYTGSAAFPNIGPYSRFGFGPDLTGLFMGQPGTMGVVTKLTCRMYPLPEAEEWLGAGFNDLSKAVKFVDELMTEKLLASCWLLHWSVPLITMAPSRDLQKLREDVLGGCEWFINLTFESSKGLIDYKRKAVEKIVQKYKPDLIGGPLPMEVGPIKNEWMYPRRIFNWFKFGNYFALAFWGPLTKFEEYHDLGLKFWKKHGLDPEKFSIIAAPTEPYCGKLSYIEMECFYDSTNRAEAESLTAFTSDMTNELIELGIYGWFRPYALAVKASLGKLKGNYVELWKKIHDIIDPNNTMNPGKLWPV